MCTLDQTKVEGYFTVINRTSLTANKKTCQWQTDNGKQPTSAAAKVEIKDDGGIKRKLLGKRRRVGWRVCFDKVKAINRKS